MTPRISVIIPTYNRKELLFLAIKSVLDQTFKDFEIIVVDDDSSDGTMETIKKFNDGRLLYIRHDKNIGVSAARNTGIRASKGSLIAFLDDDDEYLPNKLELQIEMLDKNPEISLVYVGLFYMDETGKYINHYIPKNKIWRGMIQHDPIGATPLVRKKCFDEVGLFDEDLPTSNDKDMWLRISDRYTFAFIKKPLYKVRFHQIRLTSNFEKKVHGLQKFYQKHYNRINSAPRRLKRDIYFLYYIELAIIYAIAREHTYQSRRESVKAIRLKPLSHEGYALFLFCLNEWWKNILLFIIRTRALVKIRALLKRFKHRLD